MGECVDAWFVDDCLPGKPILVAYTSHLGRFGYFGHFGAVGFSYTYIRTILSSILQAVHADFVTWLSVTKLAS